MQLLNEGSRNGHIGGSPQLQNHALKSAFMSTYFLVQHKDAAESTPMAAVSQAANAAANAAAGLQGVSGRAYEVQRAADATRSGPKQRGRAGATI